MEEERKQLVDGFKELTDTLGLDAKNKRLSELETQMAKPDFWQDQGAAKRLSTEAARLKEVVEPLTELEAELSELGEFIKLGDESMSAEISSRLTAVSKKLESLKKQNRFTGPYDDHDAILTIQSGAGGRDAADWASMLLKMYSRFSEKKGFKSALLDETTTDDGGIKSATLGIAGTNAYGLLKGEHGVHRLVRKSPFNTAGSRETSFAMVEVLPQIDEPDEVEIDESELRVDVYRAGGHGGQSVNTTDSAVRITHQPTGITVAIQNERSQIKNKETALKILRSRLAQLQLEQHKEKISELKGPNVEAAWGNQIRNYVLHPYNLVKDTRTGAETSDVTSVLDGDLNMFIDAYLDSHAGQKD